MTNPATKPKLLYPDIIGFWEGVSGDYPLIDEYRADGTFIQHVRERSTKPAAFRIDGEYMIYSIEQPNGSVEYW